MKKIKFLAAIAAVAIAVPAISAPTVTWSGEAKARYGMQYMTVDKASFESMAFLAGLREDATAAEIYGALSNTQLSAETAVSGMTPVQIQGLAALAGAGAATWDVQYTAATGVVKAAFDATKAALIAGDRATAISNLTNLGYSNDEATKVVDGYISGDYEEGTFAGQKNEQSIRINAKIEDDKLTAVVGVEFDAKEGVKAKQADISFDYGVGKITYSTIGVQNRWDENIFYVGNYEGDLGDSNVKSSLDFTYITGDNMGNVFFTFISDKAVGTPVKYENLDNRVIPIMQLGYEYSSSTIDATAGGVFDKYKGDIEDNGYTGYMFFGNVTYKMGNIGELQTGSMAFGLSGVYGQNVSAFAANDPVDMDSVTLSISQIASGVMPNEEPLPVGSADDEDSTVYGGLIFFAGSFWKGGLVYTDFRYSEAKLYGESDAFSAYKFQVAVTQYFAKNFYVMLGTGYESYSVVPDDDGIDRAWGYEAVIEAGYKF